MKKVSIGILAILYLVVSTGFTMNIHYCMGKFSSVDLNNSTKKCGKCGMKKSGGCCKNEFKTVKLNDSHKLLSNDIKIFSPVAIIDNSQRLSDLNLLYPSIISELNTHSPPEPSGTSLSILHCVFRI